MTGVEAKIEIIAAALGPTAAGIRISMTINDFGLRMACISLAAAVAACAKFAPSDPDAPLRSLVEAERAFAQASAVSGIRPAFAANFAADGISFEPAPVDASRTFFSRPAPPNASPLALDWAPVAAGIAASADFGFTTGPSTLTDRETGRSIREGVYFSVWRREPGLPWRVALDIGIDTRSRVAPDALLPSPVLANARADPASGRSAISSIETRSVDGDGYAAWFAADGRLHRDGFAPILGDANLRMHLAPAAGSMLAFAAQGGAIASSGDLAYTYGTLSVTSGASQPPLQSGYYAHLWSREASGRWRLIVAVLLPSG